MIKKVLGVIFIIFAFLLGCSTLLTIKNTFEEIRVPLSELSDTEVGYIMGIIISQLFLFAIIIILIRFGIKWLKGKQPSLKNE